MTTPHRVLVVGAGSIGERHVRCFQQTGRAEVSVCEVNAQVREDVAARYGLSAAYADLDAALAAAPQAAVVCTPAHLHVAMAARLVGAGAHVLIEKPLSTKDEGIDALQQLADERQRVVGVAYVLRCHPALAAMREALRSRRFGRPVELVAVAGQHFPHYRPAYREIYYADRATGGGAIQDALTHVVNAGEWLLGPAARVAADAAHQVLEGVTVEDTVHVIARHAVEEQDGAPAEVLASYSLNQHQAPNESTITVVCEAGTLRFEAHHRRWRWAAAAEEPWHDEQFPALERDTLFVAQAAAFLDAVEGQAPPRCTLEAGRQTLRVNLAILAAAESGRWQNVER